MLLLLKNINELEKLFLRIGLIQNINKKINHPHKFKNIYLELQ